jgi:PIN domain nuclease of toxin-antitoxin system
MKYLLDTHVWVLWNAQPESLSHKVLKILSAPEESDEFLLSALSVWEFSQLLASNRLGLACSAEEWIRRALDHPNLRLAPLSPAIAYQATVLPEALAGDWVDQILVATAREENATLLTQDPTLLGYRHVHAVW